MWGGVGGCLVVLVLGVILGKDSQGQSRVNGDHWIKDQRSKIKDSPLSENSFLLSTENIFELELNIAEELLIETRQGGGP